MKTFEYNDSSNNTKTIAAGTSIQQEGSAVQVYDLEELIAVFNLAPGESVIRRNE